MKFTDDVLNKLNTINNFLNRIDTLIEENKWDEIVSIFDQINAINNYLESRSLEVNSYIEKYGSFFKKYNDKKSGILELTVKIEKKIKKWIENQKVKIAGSKNIVDNISRYKKKNELSYFIDKKE